MSKNIKELNVVYSEIQKDDLLEIYNCIKEHKHLSIEIFSTDKNNSDNNSWIKVPKNYRLDIDNENLIFEINNNVKIVINIQNIEKIEIEEDEDDTDDYFNKITIYSEVV